MRGRRVVIPTALALLLLALAALWSGGEKGAVTVALNGEDAPAALTEDGHVWLTVEPAAVTATGAAVTLHTRGIPRIGYGDSYYIARKEHHNSREWTEVPWRDSGGPSWWALLNVMGFDPDSVPEEERREDQWDMETGMRVDWTDVYGPLEPGEYLFVKEVVDPSDRSASRYIGAEFTVK